MGSTTEGGRRKNVRRDVGCVLMLQERYEKRNVRRTGLGTAVLYGRRERQYVVQVQALRLPMWDEVGWDAICKNYEWASGESWD